MAFTLVIGNKNYSSWSLRPWIAMRTKGIAFAERVIPLYEPGSREEILKVSPAGKVPVLIDGDATVWESLAILEHLAERVPEAQLWPAGPPARAHARAIAAEMHAGFSALRRHCPMNMRRPVKKRPPSPAADADARRIAAMWTDCRARFGRGGPFLFGAFTAADAMYAPVVSRFHTYAVDAEAPVRAYMQAMMALPAWREWEEAGRKESWVMADNEVD
jgi:glutathione S-transferase